jgi:Ca2+-binding EF-hand superfamily protein
MLVNLGQNGDDAIVDKYMKSALKDGSSGSERINFTQFLTMFGEHLSEVCLGEILVGEEGDQLSAC